MNDESPRESFHHKLNYILTAGIVSLVVTLGFPFGERLWDKYISDRPFILATVEVKQDGDAEPYIMYDADPNREVDGTWVASLVDEDGQQILTRQGLGFYRVADDEPRRWSWFAFFDNEKGLNSPGVPDVPFKACVRYVVVSRSTSVPDSTDNYCSELFTARF